MFGKQRDVFVYNQTKETFLAFRVKVADSILGRLIGLLGRRSLQPDSGVWIVPANAVHTIGMLFAFDLVLLDKNFKVVGIRELLHPFRITMPKRKAESVLELPAHTIFRSRTQIGDQLLIERYEARKPSKPALLDPLKCRLLLPQSGLRYRTNRLCPLLRKAPAQRYRARAWRRPRFDSPAFVVAGGPSRTRGIARIHSCPAVPAFASYPSFSRSSSATLPASARWRGQFVPARQRIWLTTTLTLLP
jgi:hypothetical protein